MSPHSKSSWSVNLPLIWAAGGKPWASCTPAASVPFGEPRAQNATRIRYRLDRLHNWVHSEKSPWSLPSVKSSYSKQPRDNLMRIFVYFSSQWMSLGKSEKDPNFKTQHQLSIPLPLCPAFWLEQQKQMGWISRAANNGWCHPGHVTVEQKPSNPSQEDRRYISYNVSFYNKLRISEFELNHQWRCEAEAVVQHVREK